MVPHTVLDAFGLGGTPWRLPGGEERTYHQRVEAFLAFEHARHFDQLLLRALIRSLLVADGFGKAARVDEYRPSIDIVRARLAR